MKRLVETVLGLVGAARTMSPANQKDNVMISPQSLNALFSSGLFSDTALNDLYELAEKPDLNSGPEYMESNNALPDISLLIPHKLLSLYGDVFVELVKVFSHDSYVFLDIPSSSSDYSLGSHQKLLYGMHTYSFLLLVEWIQVCRSVPDIDQDESTNGDYLR